MGTGGYVYAEICAANPILAMGYTKVSVVFLEYWSHVSHASRLDNLVCLQPRLCRKHEAEVPFLSGLFPPLSPASYALCGDLNVTLQEKPCPS